MAAQQATHLGASQIQLTRIRGARVRVTQRMADKAASLTKQLE
jgi:hypothetical protein